MVPHGFSYIVDPKTVVMMLTLLSYTPMENSRYETGSVS